MTRKTLTLLLMALSALGAGCAAHSRRSVVDAWSGHNLLFGPAEPGLPTYDTPRGHWPATAAYRPDQESVTFRETIIDRQGRHFGQRDDYYRRFDSVREGRTRR